MLKLPYFKLICGASLRHTDEIQRLSAIYSEAGADLIDVAADPQAVKAAIDGSCSSKALVMVSVAVGDDPHVLVINRSNCTDCERCISFCQGLIDSDRCVGCGRCLTLCACLSLVRRENSPQLDECWDAGARGLELHTGSGNQAEILPWKTPCTDWVKRGGIFSCSINTRQLGEEEACRLAHEIRAWFDGPIIIQADGNPLSGRPGEASTLPALTFAKKLLESGLDAWIQPAGGANEETGRLANKQGIAISGVGMGSVARQAIHGIEGDAAVRAAKRLVESVVG